VLVLTGINVAFGGLLGLLGLRVMRSLRARYYSQMAARQEAEQKARLTERSRLQTFYAMIETLSATIDYRLVLESTLDLSSNALGSMEDIEGLISAVLLFGQHDLEVATARGFSAADCGAPFRAKAGCSGWCCKAANAHPGSAGRDEELQQIIALQTCRTVLALPLLRGLNAYGVIIFGHPQEGFFTRDRVEVLK
jgi:hypothetical protein